LLTLSEYWPNSSSITPYGFTNATLGQYNFPIVPNIGYNSNVNLTPSHSGYFVPAVPAGVSINLVAPTINSVYIVDLQAGIHFNVLLPSTSWMIQGSTFTHGSHTLTIVSNAPSYYLVGYVSVFVGSGTYINHGVYTRGQWP